MYVCVCVCYRVLSCESPFAYSIVVEINTCLGYYFSTFIFILHLRYSWYLGNLITILGLSDIRRAIGGY